MATTTDQVTGFGDESALLRRVKRRSRRVVAVATAAVIALAAAVEVFDLSGAWLVGGALVIVVASITTAAIEL
jgi:hypothetical protein